MNIKKIVLIVLSGAMLFTGCSKDLDIVQDNSLTSSNMWKTEADVKSAVYGSYIYLRNTFKTSIAYWGEYRNGLWGAGTHGTLQNPEMGSTVTSTMNATNNGYASWTSLYTTINHTNLIIKYAGQMQISQNTKDFALSNAYFIRAYCYFWIGRIWGDAPLALEGFESTNQELYLSRSPQSEVFKQVESDIRLAEQHILSSATDKTIATPASVAMLKADFGLWMYSVQKAGDSYLSLAESAVSDLKLSPAMLESDFGNIFNPATKKGKEVIWVIPQNQGESTDGFMRAQIWGVSYVQTQYRNTSVPVIENQWWIYTDEYLRIINGDSTDKRAAVTYDHGPYGVNNAEVGWANKYIGRIVSGTRVLDDDIILYRYAQAYLFDAEIKYHKKDYSGALSSLDVVTNRAYRTSSYYTSQTPDAVLHAIVTENLKEFANEGNTWWTLIRTDAVWDYNPNVASQKAKNNILLWPITQAAINRNYNLTQTTGW